MEAEDLAADLTVGLRGDGWQQDGGYKKLPANVAVSNTPNDIRVKVHALRIRTTVICKPLPVSVENAGVIQKDHLHFASSTCYTNNTWY